MLIHRLLETDKQDALRLQQALIDLDFEKALKAWTRSMVKASSGSKPTKRRSS